jgi:branched-chain amino acid transport system substrate-binding protein
MRLLQKTGKASLGKILLILWGAYTCASCSSSASGAASDTTKVKIVSSLAMTGTSLGQDQTIVNSIKQALDETNSQVCNGKVKIDFQVMDDSTAAAGKWDPGQETENANKAVADSEIVAYIGPVNSGAAKLSIPILNQANLVAISPATTYPGLTKQGKGEAKEPNIYYPNGKRNFARVIPSDDIQGLVAAKWAQSLGVKRVFILDDQELYGKGVADVFDASAKKVGMTVLGHEGIDPKATDYKALMTKIRALNPDLVYFGGIVENGSGQLVKDMRNVGMTGSKVKFMGPDGLYTPAFISAVGKENADGVYATFSGIPPEKLTGAGKTWYDNYKAKYKSEPESYSAYSYDATKVVLKAIDKVCKNDRAAIRDEVLGTRNYPGLLGTWSFDPNGDTSLTAMSGMTVKDGKWQFAQALKD